MKKKLFALAMVALSFAGCAQVDQVKEGVKQAPTDFWASLHAVLGFLVDLLSGVGLGWLKGVLGL